MYFIYQFGLAYLADLGRAARVASMAKYYGLTASAGHLGMWQT